MVKKERIPFTKFSCCMFDPCSIAPFILFPNSKVVCQTPFARASIMGTMAEITPPMEANHTGDFPPWAVAIPQY